jgi:hypothetical protein
MSQEYDAISDKVLEAFNALPAKSKPRTINDKVKEWVPLSGIVVTVITYAPGAFQALLFCKYLLNAGYVEE